MRRGSSALSDTRRDDRGSRDDPRRRARPRRRRGRFPSFLPAGDLPRLALAAGSLVAAFGLAVWTVERSSGAMFRRAFDGLWWAVVTFATVGYGDKAPQTDAGKALGIVMIVASVVLSSLISGTIAAIFVDRRIKEGKGLRDIHLGGHRAILGWNRDGSRLLSGFEAASQESRVPVVLVNMMEPEAFDSLRASFPGLELRFVRGDFTQEATLRKAAIGAASSVVILPDETGGATLANADERVILAALAVKSIDQDLSVSAQIRRAESEQHLRRARVDEIILEGELSSFMLAAGAAEPGVPRAVRSLLSWNGPRIRQAPFPATLRGKSYADASAWFLKEGKGCLVGVLSREKRVSFDDLLSDDSSAIDAFIKRKFREADIDLEAEGSGEEQVRLDPGAGYAIREGDLAFLVGGAGSEAS